MATEKGLRKCRKEAIVTGGRGGRDKNKTVNVISSWLTSSPPQSINETEVKANTDFSSSRHFSSDAKSDRS